MRYSRASPGLGRRGLALLGRHGRFAWRAAAGLDEAAPGPRRAGVRAGGRGDLGLATISGLHSGVLDLGISNYIISTTPLLLRGMLCSDSNLINSTSIFFTIAL